MKSLWFSSLLLLLLGCRPDAKYNNLVDTPYATGGSNVWSATWALFFEDDPRSFPDREVPIKKFHAEDLQGDLSAVWLGHASVLVKIGPYHVLTDPVFSERLGADWIGPKRFHPLPLEVKDLPAIDAVVISHDHADHLDTETIKLLKDKVKMFYVPMDVGSFLQEWGVPLEKIKELGWWRSVKDGELEITCTPARHMSGRGLWAYNQTLWSGWALKHQNRRVFFGGDTGIFPGFTEIGERLGPFDLTLMPIGAYDVYWAGIHLSPEEAVRAHKMVKGKWMMPVHWGTFDLSRHPWDEPLKRLREAATDVKTVLPIPGEAIVVP